MLSLTKPATQGKPDEHLVALLNRSSEQVLYYKSLRYVLERLRATRGSMCTVAVTSATVEEGKTTTAINLAGVSAHRPDARVLLIDADLRGPSVGARLGLPEGTAERPGLVDAILDPERSLESVLVHLPAFNLWFLPAGNTSDDPYELLRTPRIGELLQEARKQFDLVLLDTPPLLLFPDSRVLENLVDAFLLVVAADRTPRKAVEEALTLLEPSSLIGLVYNGDDRPTPSYYSRYYRALDRSRQAVTTAGVQSAFRWRRSKPSNV
jgi:receptor protein-tyrosine kinase/non-specific protein-tyrosine kinase